MDSRPNILYVVADEFRPYSMGFLGREKVITPNFDAFSRGATTFTRCASNFPVCSPYRGILFSGKYPHENGVPTNCNSDRIGLELHGHLRCFTDVLADEGFSQGYIGKLHLDSPRPGDELYGEGKRGNGVVWDAYTPPGPRRHGIDFWHSYGCCDNHNDPHYWRGNDPVDKPFRPGKWSTEHETDVAIEYLKNNDGQRDPNAPFMLSVSWNPPHMPFEQVPQRYKDLYKDVSAEELLDWENITADGREKCRNEIHNYFAMISGVDDNFGRLMSALDEEGLSENTIVIFTSDHGEMMGSHGQKRKGQWYNESFLVPFLIRWPGKTRPGVMDDTVFSTIDLAPTLLGLAGCSASIPADYRGEDLHQRLLDGTSPAKQEALYIRNGVQSYLGNRGVMTERYTYVVERKNEGETYSLIDNLEDPHQFTNRYESDSPVVRDLHARLVARLQEVDDPFAWFLAEHEG